MKSSGHSRKHECGFESSLGARYCQGCGVRIKTRKTIRQIFSQLHFDTLAGMGSKGVSAAPLFTENLFGTSKNGSERPKVKIIFKDDKSWFCPDCGQYNEPHSIFCQQCAREI